MGVIFSGDIIATSPSSTGLSTMNSFLPTRLTFTSNGGVLETQMVKKNEQYKTSVIFLESDSGTPILNAVINIHGDIGKADISSNERLNSGIYFIYITPKTEHRLSFQIEASKSGFTKKRIFAAAIKHWVELPLKAQIKLLCNEPESKPFDDIVREIVDEQIQKALKKKTAK